jgi:hypothetical protein
MNIDDRLRAASRALRDSSVAQVDAASPLREIVRHTGQPVTHGRTTFLPDEPELPGPVAPSLPPEIRSGRKPQRLAIAVNLLLVLALGILLVRAAWYGQDLASTAPSPTASTVAVTQAEIPPKVQTQIRVPPACLDAQELADEVISRLNRNDRDSRFADALRDYTVASQACRRAASP